MTSSNKTPTPSPTPNSWLRQIIFWLVELYYPRLEVNGIEKVPANKPVLFVANHPNGLLDPLLIMLGMKREVAFLAMSKLFRTAFGRFFLNTFGAIPVYRRKDVGEPGGPAGERDAAHKNEETFARCRQILHNGGSMALFPEGITHSDPTMQKFHTGAARIALSTEAESGWLSGVTIVPVGLWYENKGYFRTSTLLVVGEPFTLDSYREGYEADPRQTARKITAQIKEGLDAVVLQAENVDLLRGLPMVASWLAPQFDELPLIEQHAMTNELIETYKFIKEKDPQRLARFSDEARRYAQALLTLGIKDPWELELPAATTGRPRRLLTFLICAAPFAALGGLISAGPYYAVRPIANRYVGEHTSILSTVKLIGGIIFVLIGWIITAILIGVIFGGLWGWLLFLLAPLLGYTALRWGEAWQEWSALTSYEWLRLSNTELPESLTTRREQLMAEVVDVLQAQRLATGP